MIEKLVVVPPSGEDQLEKDYGDNVLDRYNQRRKAFPRTRFTLGNILFQKAPGMEREPFELEDIAEIGFSSIPKFTSGGVALENIQEAGSIGYLTNHLNVVQMDKDKFEFISTMFLDDYMRTLDTAEVIDMGKDWIKYIFYEGLEKGYDVFNQTNSNYKNLPTRLFESMGHGLTLPGVEDPF